MICVIGFVHISYSMNIDKTVFSELDRIISMRKAFTKKKQNKIDSIKKYYQQGKTDKFSYYSELVCEYQAFQFDSAYYYSEKLLQTAYLNNRTDQVAEAKIVMSNILISTGMLKESYDSLLSIDTIHLVRENKFKYYTVLSRLYLDLESYSNNKRFSDYYHSSGIECLDMALKYTKPHSWQYLSTLGQKHFRKKEYEKALDVYEDLITCENLSPSQLAVESFWLSFVYKNLGMHQKSTMIMVQGSIADMKEAKKDAASLMHIAKEIYEDEDVERANRYINVAMEQSNFYGSNLRLTQIMEFMPLIKSRHIEIIEKQKRELWFYMGGVLLLSLFVLAFLFVIFKQNNKLKKTKKHVEQFNKELSVTNDQLSESNKIKEEYLGFFFSLNSQMIEKMEVIKASVNRKYEQRRFDDLVYDLKRMNLKKERELLFENFDRVFLRIFPKFIEKFNELLKSDQQIVLKEDQLLNTELRIFALIRLGINNNEKIAKILDYSVNTVYSYKTKVRNKSHLINEKFDEEVMKIRRF